MERKVSTAELAELPLFRGISQADLSWMLRQCDVVSLNKDWTLLSTSKDNDTIYILLDGRLSVQFDPQHGGMRKYIEEGGWVGEMSVIDSMRPSATVVTVTEVRLLAIHASIWWKLIERSHAAARNSLHALSSRVRQDNEVIAEGMQKQLMFSEKAETDSLTGLRNRRWLDEKLPDILLYYADSEQACSILMLDIDHFKKFNDEYGHLSGDRVLQSVAQVVQENLRDNDAAVRFGGEEIILVLPGINTSDAKQFALRLRHLIRDKEVKNYDTKVLPSITVSTGVYTIVRGDSTEQVLRRVDSALYQAKQSGRDRVVVWQAG